MKRLARVTSSQVVERRSEPRLQVEAAAQIPAQKPPHSGLCSQLFHKPLTDSQAVSITCLDPSRAQDRPGTS